MVDTTIDATLRSFIESSENRCFVCGQHNPAGLHVHFTQTGGVIQAEWVASRNHMSWSGVIHGGVLTSLLDEAMAYTLFTRGFMAVTARLEVRFRSSARAGDRLGLEARCVTEKRNIADVEASISAGSRLVAEASARFMKLGPFELSAVLNPTE